MNKISIIILTIIVLIIGSFFLYYNNSSKNSSNLTSTSVETTNPNGAEIATSTTATKFTMAEIARHNGRASCYTAIRGLVYDLTSAINTHPGGPDKILALCGKDGTDAFVNQHGGRPRQEAGLAKLQIGILVQ